MTTKRLPELLSPVGSMESLYAAVQNGCDAVYLGGKQFSARQYAGNFSLEELEEACDYCHLRGVKVYVTVNTLYKEKEILELLGYIEKLYKIGVDALILQDMGASMKIHQAFPDFPLHASTQMTTNSLADVEYLYRQGFSKIVLSRELSVEEIEHITKNTEAEIETFIHGALCVSYSGQCIMSSMLGGRSGNRGRCAQTCRLPYSLYCVHDKLEEGHLLSPKDMATITILPELVEAGIASLKIEGRMKNPEYVAGVTKIYRKYLNLYQKDPDNYKVEETDLKNLMQLFNRGGFTEGYYKNFSGSDMMSVERPKTWGVKIGHVDSYVAKVGKVTIRTREQMVPGDGIEVWTKTEPHVGSNISKQSKPGDIISLTIRDADITKNDVVYKTFDKSLTDALRKTWEKDTRKKPIFMELKAEAGQALTIKLWDADGHMVYLSGDVVEAAQSQPMTEVKIKEQATKTGATPFVVDDITLFVGENVYLPIRSINDLRRQATDALAELIIKKSKRDAVTFMEKEEKERNPFVKQKKINALVSTGEQAEAVISYGKINILYVEMNDGFERNWEEWTQQCHEKNMKFYVAFPRIQREYNEKEVEAMVDILKNSEIDGFLVRTPGQFALAKETGKKIVIDYTFNVMNQDGIAYWQTQGADMVCISSEMNLEEINQTANADSEMLVYGYLPLMTTHQCPIGAYHGGKKEGRFCEKKGTEELYFLKDRKGMKFPLMPDCKNCVCSILNGNPLFTLKFYNEVLESTTGSVRLYFTKEGPKRTERIVRAYDEMTEDPLNASLETKVLLEEMEERGSTKGHFFRGVE